MSVKSMTGYGRASRLIDGNEITIDIKSVNHRYFDFNSKISKDYLFLEEKIKSAVKKSVSRGKIDFYMFINIDAACAYEVELNEPLARGYVDALEVISKTLKIKNDVTASFISRIPDVVSVKKTQFDETKLEESVLSVLNDALESYDSMRSAEGERLLNDILENLNIILENILKIEKLAPESVEVYKQRLRAKMIEALDGKEYDQQRLITEVAIFADRIDVGEETVRLESHISQFRTLLNSSAEPVGKKLDFIIQEMNREINTIGSKCSCVEITKLVVDTKSVIEKIREQIQNIE